MCGAQMSALRTVRGVLMGVGGLGSRSVRVKPASRGSDGEGLEGGGKTRSSDADQNYKRKDKLRYKKACAPMN